MTTDQAINELKKNKPSRVFGNEDYCDAYEIAIEALEKQIPEKPTDVEIDYGTFDCPVCGTKIITMEDGFESHRYCLNCGQRIDWSEVET